jgi:hypothetical protein
VSRLGWRKLLVISVPALLFGALLAAAGAEIYVRATWDARKGTPGFFLTDAALGQRLAPGYDGWFAGVPVHIDRLGLRDPREYALAKGPRTFRILVLGDSVTFGHGSVYEHTYPYLTEQKLRAWRADVDWQVWNAAVPGYNTSQELAQLLELAPSFQPDLVVVGFFENDVVDNKELRPPGALMVAAARTASLARRHLYSFELYKRIALTIAWALSKSDDYRRRVDNLGSEESLLSSAHDASRLKEQELTPFERLTDEQVSHVSCYYGMKPNADVSAAIEKGPGYGAWLDAVRGFQTLNAGGRRIVFYLNIVPPTCPDGDVFYDGGTGAINRFYMKILSDGTPAVSCYDAFLHVRPSQMPNADAHAIGNSNLVKAEVLFGYLRDRVLPEALPASLREPPPAGPTP